MFRIWPPEDSGGAGGVGVGRPIVVILMEYITNVRSRIGDGISNLSETLEMMAAVSRAAAEELVEYKKTLEEGQGASEQENLTETVDSDGSNG